MTAPAIHFTCALCSKRTQVQASWRQDLLPENDPEKYQNDVEVERAHFVEENRVYNLQHVFCMWSFFKNGFVVFRIVPHQLLHVDRLHRLSQLIQDAYPKIPVDRWVAKNWRPPPVLRVLGASFSRSFLLDPWIPGS